MHFFASPTPHKHTRARCEFQHSLKVRSTNLKLRLNILGRIIRHFRGLTTWHIALLPQIHISRRYKLVQCLNPTLVIYKQWIQTKVLYKEKSLEKWIEF